MPLPVYSPDGRFRGAVGNVRDMTELMQLRQQMDITYLDDDREMQVKEKANRELVKRINEMLHLMEDYDIVGRSKAMHNLAELALRVSHVRSTVLITGESGVGKDVFCRMICRFAGSPDYIKISCGNLRRTCWNQSCSAMRPAPLPANRRESGGIFELAGDGVIWTKSATATQLRVKLLTAQDRRFYRIGGTAPCL
ncbi:MAG: sigma 54-interacting transcriptional regulator [Flavonifractor plautii]